MFTNLTLLHFSVLVSHMKNFDLTHIWILMLELKLEASLIIFFLFFLHSQIETQKAEEFRNYFESLWESNSLFSQFRQFQS